MKQESPTFKKIFHKGLNSEINRKNAIDLIKSKVYDTWDMGYFTAVKSILDPKNQKKYALQIDSSNDKESLKYFMKRFIDEKAILAQLEENKKKPRKKSKFQKKLEEIQRKHEKKMREK